jgi:nucleolar protein 12
MAAENGDGTLFMERIIRVDLVGMNSEAGSLDTDPKLSVFVGNLDFAIKEEDLRVFFKGLMTSAFLLHLMMTWMKITRGNL